MFRERKFMFGIKGIILIASLGIFLAGCTTDEVMQAIRKSNERRAAANAYPDMNIYKAEELYQFKKREAAAKARERKAEREIAGLIQRDGWIDYEVAIDLIRKATGSNLEVADSYLRDRFVVTNNQVIKKK